MLWARNLDVRSHFPRVRRHPTETPTYVRGFSSQSRSEIKHTTETTSRTRVKEARGEEVEEVAGVTSGERRRRSVEARRTRRRGFRAAPSHLPSAPVDTRVCVRLRTRKSKRPAVVCFYLKLFLSGEVKWRQVEKKWSSNFKLWCELQSFSAPFSARV